MTRRTRRYGTLALAAAALAACGESELQNASSDATVAAAPAESSGALIAVADFEATFDSETGQLSFEMLPPVAPQFEVPETDGLVTVPQALWCSLRILDNNNTNSVRLNTVAGSVQTSFEDCGITRSPLIEDFGALCADIRLTNNYLDTLRRPMAMITEITANYEGYTYNETSGEIGVDTTTLPGPGAPTDLTGGLFGYTNLPSRGFADTRWGFHNAGGSFHFRGQIVAEATEICNGADDDCDGRVDEGAGCVAEGAACRDHEDCQSGNCTEALICGASTCSDGLLNGAETGVDCGGTCDGCANGFACVDDGDCTSNVCQSLTCAAYRRPTNGSVVFTELMPDPGDTVGEWFEVKNTTAETLNLEGCSVYDAANNTHVIGALTIPANGYLLFAHSSDPLANHGLPTPAEVYPSAVSLNNGGDTLTLQCDGNEIDFVEYAGSAVVRYYSLSLNDASTSVLGNNTAANFCSVDDTYSTGFYGTPGGQNPTCDVVISSCVLDRPASLEVTTGGGGQLYTRINAPGLTDLSTGLDENGRVRVQVGFGPVGTTPATAPTQWAWFAANGVTTWTDTAAPGLDEYVAAIVAPSTAGTSYAVRARASGNAGATYTACAGESALSVIAPIEAPSAAGQVIFSELMPDPGTTQNGEWFELHNTTSGAFDLAGCGITDNAATYTIPSTLIIPADGYIVIANCNDAATCEGMGVADLVQPNVIQLGNSGDTLTLTCNSTTIDAFVYSSTFDVDSQANQLDPSQFSDTLNDDQNHWCPSRSISTFGLAGNLKRGTPGEANLPCYPIDFCRLQAPTSIVDATPNAATDVTARVGIPDLTALGVTNLSRTMVRAQVGVAEWGGDPSADPGSWSWTDATTNAAYAGDEPAYDEYVAAMPHPADAGEYGYVFRFSGDDGATWAYCDVSGGAPEDFASPAIGQLSVAPPAGITGCGIMTNQLGQVLNGADSSAFFPSEELSIVVAGVEATGAATVEIGYIAQADSMGATPDDTWTWTPAAEAFTSFYGAAIYTPPAVSGPYYAAARASGDGGATWTYCDALDLGDGMGGEPTNHGSVDGYNAHAVFNVVPRIFMDCNVVGTWPQTATVGQPIQFAVNVSVPGLTDDSTGQDMTAAMLDYVVHLTGNGDLPDIDIAAAPNTTYGPGTSTYQAGYDQYVATWTPSAAGTQQVGFALQVAGDTPTFCGPGGGTTPGTVTVSEPGGGGGPCLLISQYLEGGGSNKGIELWNCGSSELDLSAYSLCLYSNGASSCSATMALSGSLAAGAVRTYCNSGWALSPACDQSNNSVLNHNGDDRFKLYLTSSGTTVDAFGQLTLQTNQWADKTFTRFNCTPYLGVAAWLVTDYFVQVGGKDDATGWGVAPTCTSGP
ncbi:MAG: lamin tail domain-containing protein [Myxococcales bacterium]|nr:lamin tail domain-containing protein [Myxococcales bacterium]MCB9520267.1 lamin tail domain-containing protein [Myxococcales bacterium]MCB9531365.1 lamin tail domain-containing protein [Myxococcales bacterium]MCB9533562.1 lamin tail domain-containing protein [Myxococcales bacterium]